MSTSTELQTGWGAATLFDLPSGLDVVIRDGAAVLIAESGEVARMTRQQLGVLICALHASRHVMDGFVPS